MSRLRESATDVAPIAAAGRCTPKWDGSGPHIIIHDEVGKSERDGFPIDLSTIEPDATFLCYSR